MSPFGILIFIITTGCSSLFVISFSLITFTKRKALIAAPSKQSAFSLFKRTPSAFQRRPYTGRVFESCEDIKNAAKQRPLTIVLIDNYDSYTYNLYQYLCEMVDHVIVITNDFVALDDDSSFQTTWNAVLSHLNSHFPEVKRLDGIILGPGPGNPSVMHDVGICAAVSVIIV